MESQQLKMTFGKYVAGYRPGDVGWSEIDDQVLKSVIAPKSYFLLIKQAGFSKNQESLSAYESAKLLLNSKIWPLWRSTKCRHLVSAGDVVLIYIAGNEENSTSVIASATVSSVEAWQRKHEPIYPLILDGIPEKALILDKIMFFKPLDVRTLLDHLSFTPANRNKWGVAFMGGMRRLDQRDFMTMNPANQMEAL